MKLKYIKSTRAVTNQPSFAIVYEWEDIISRKLQLKIKNDSKLYHFIYRRFQNLRITSLFHFFRLRKTLNLRFIMLARTQSLCILDRSTIPVIIDFWLSEKELDAFYRAYRKCPLVLITSAEVYAFLVSRGCPLNIEHWALSLPDKYRVKEDTQYKKIYDFCFLGRPNPFFKRMLEKYSEENPSFVYVLNNDDINDRKYWTNKGNFISNDTGRDSYIDIIRKAKITCYSTPGMDESKKETMKFNQVTPRVLEMIAGGCYIIGHYPDNEDTRFYDLRVMVPNVNNYDEFKVLLDTYRNLPSRNIAECAAYLESNYTSSRACILKTIMKKNNIRY